MRYGTPLCIIPALLLVALPAFAVEITSLADCSVKVFTEISRTQKWSGKTPAGCPARVAVEKRPNGIFVIAWADETADGGWVRTAFSAGMSYAEISVQKGLNRASRDIVERAGRIGHCLESIITVNDPLECRDRAVTSYRAGEVTGTENKRLVWIDDDGRHAVAEYSFGTATATPSPPADLLSGQPLPPGITIDLHLRDVR